MYAGSEEIIKEKGGHLCIQDLKMENERLRGGLNKNVVNANMSMHQKIKQYEQFDFPVYLTEDDFIVESNEGMSN